MIFSLATPPNVVFRSSSTQTGVLTAQVEALIVSSNCSHFSSSSYGAHTGNPQSLLSGCLFQARRRRLTEHACIFPFSINLAWLPTPPCKEQGSSIELPWATPYNLFFLPRFSSSSHSSHPLPPASARRYSCICRTSRLEAVAEDGTSKLS